MQDEISTGLDSATTFQIVRNLRDVAHLLDFTIMVALLQPAPEVFDLFDDVLLLSEGRGAGFLPPSLPFLFPPSPWPPSKSGYVPVHYAA